MTYKNDRVVPSSERLQHDMKKDEGTTRRLTGQKAIKRTRHSFYLDTATVRSLDQAYKETYHELYPREISKSDFLEECLHYALLSLDKIKGNLGQNE